MRRKRRRNIRYRPGNRRGLRLVRAGLVCALAVSVILSAQVFVRSARTAKLNRELNALHTVEEGAAPDVEIAAPPAGESNRFAGAGMTLAYMGLPDGSPIAPAAVNAAPADLHKTSGDVLPDMLKLLRTNGDTVGWLYINGIVSLPVVYRDNEYYLTHDFSGHHNTSGALFLDEDTPLTPQARNLLIHGHSMFDGSMFGLLTHYQKLDTVRQRPLISFSTPCEKETYCVFAVLKVTSNPADPAYFDYSGRPFVTDAAFNAYVQEAKARSLFEIPVDVKPSDALLTLSTCLDDDRLVVIARKLRSGETRDEMTSAAAEAYQT